MTPYALAKRSNGRISRATAYRLTQNRGRARMFDDHLLEALCDIFDLEPGEILEREVAPKKRTRR